MKRLLSFVMSLVFLMGIMFQIPVRAYATEETQGDAITALSDTTDSSAICEAEGHKLVSHSAKYPTCTTTGYLSYNTCKRCSYTTLNEVSAYDHSYEREINAVAHRGYSSLAPENTLPAYELAKEMGFTYVECDISFTKDGIPVLLHDSTIDRTSNGSGDVTKLTYQQLLQHDFGEWKDEKYSGTKIPTFEEFISLCKELGLKPYIELKGTTAYKQSHVQTLINILDKYDMREVSTWISFTAKYLTYVTNIDEDARIGLLQNNDASNGVIAEAKKLMNGKNEVFLDLNYTKVTTGGVLRAATNGIPLEVYTIDTEEEILALPAYVSGVTSNVLDAQDPR